MIWLVVLAALLLLDHITTEYTIKKYGIDIESNPLSRWMQIRFGGNLTFLAQSTLMMSLMFLMYYNLPEIMFVLPLAFSITILNNLRVIFCLLRSKGKANIL